MKNQVWIHNLKNHSTIKNQLLNAIKKTKKQSFKDKIDSISYTDYYEKLSLENNEYFSIFNSNAEKFYNEFLKFYCIKQMKIINVWFQQYLKNDIHQFHFHGGSNISFVYYVELKNKKESTEFYDIINKDVFQLNVKEGDIIIFPSHIPHRSPAIKTKNRKTIISCNLNLDKVNLDFMKGV